MPGGFCVYTSRNKLWLSSNTPAPGIIWLCENALCESLFKENISSSLIWGEKLKHMKHRGSKSRRQVKELLDDFSQLLPQLVRCSLTHETFVCLLGSSVNHRPCELLWTTIKTIYQSQVSIRLDWHAAAGLAVLGGAGTGWAQGRSCTRSEDVQQEHCCALGSGHSTGVWGTTGYLGGTARLHPPKYPVEVSPESQSCLRQSQSPIPSPGACMLDPLLSHFSQTKPNCSLISPDHFLLPAQLVVTVEKSWQ